ncbi:ABC transporter substrate-binding protein [Dyadobacter sediminis]|uniref:ABC transporter substrate-binding protein n=1 Tax=Dyadobacter sediminis TaxID=1493691 RepID=UPI0019A6AB23|nr:ABC transporter substrate-binding protein [Dyadobacter sediminis]GGC13733.1 ABC transporter substrate-binding protein [Dyadobacter sediminis]
MNYSRIRLLLLKNALPFLVLITVYGCNCSESQSEQKISKAEGKNYYNEKAEVKYAKGFTIDYFSHYKIVNVIGTSGQAADTAKYLLLERGTARPEGFSKAQLIEIPVRSMAVMSSMHVGLLGFLGSENVLTGLANLQYVYSPEVIKMISSGKIAEIGRDQGLNEEKLIEMHPGLLMTMGSPGAKNHHYQTLEQAGIPVLTNSEWIENTPLARAEWVKVVAALLNKEKEVNTKFAEMEQEYSRIASLAAKVKDKPAIISGLNTKDAWFLPGGDSYMARFFKDAGADYHWNDVKTDASLPLNFEAVYPFALNADFWLNVGFDKNDTKKGILAMDSRYGDFKAFKSGKMYSYNNRVNERGSNDFFESGTVNPHIVLSDLIKILHPELLPDHQLVYYKQLR